MATPVTKRLDDRIIKLWSKIADPNSWETAFDKWEDLLTPFDPRYPQPGFIGKGYFRNPCRILIMGINPGPGKGFEARDEILFGATLELARTPNADNFKSLMSVYSKQMPHWGIFSRQNIFNRLDLSLENIAYLNVLQVNTKVDCSDSKLNRVYEYAISKFTFRQLKLLQPHAILILGKHGIDVLNKYWPESDRPDGLEVVHVWHPAYRGVRQNPAEFEKQMNDARKVIRRQLATHSV